VYDPCISLYSVKRLNITSVHVSRQSGCKTSLKSYGPLPSVGCQRCNYPSSTASGAGRNANANTQNQATAVCRVQPRLHSFYPPHSFPTQPLSTLNNSNRNGENMAAAAIANKIGFRPSAKLNPCHYRVPYGVRNVSGLSSTAWRQ
jgi:hypothetical protein